MKGVGENSTSSLSQSSPPVGTSNDNNNNNKGGKGGEKSAKCGSRQEEKGGRKKEVNEEAMKALRSWVRESLVDSKERNERGGYYELLDAFSSINENNENNGEETTVAKKIDESVVALVDALAEHATYVEYRAHEHLLERVTLEKCSTVSLRTCDDAYYASASQFLINLATVKGGSCVQFAMQTFVKAFFGDEKEAKKEEMLLLESRGGNDRRYRMSRFNNNNSVSGANEAAKHRERENVENRRRERAVHSVVQILKLVPLSAKVFSHVLFDMFPHKTCSAMVLAAYLDCAFRCAESAECRNTELADDFLCLCVSKALEIDVEIKWEDLQQGFDDDETSEEEEDEEEDSEMFGEENGDDRDTDSRENDEEDIFELDEFNAAIDDANINNGKASWKNNKRNRSKKKQNHNHGRNSNDNNINNMETDEAAHALDEMMFLVLEYLQKRIESANQIIGAQAAAAAPPVTTTTTTTTAGKTTNDTNRSTGDENYRNAKKSIERLREALVSRAFFTTLLPAPKSKFAQYIVFYLCSMDINDGGQQNSAGANKSSCELLRDGLVAKMLNSNEANSLRLAAAAYLASFVARAKFLSAEFVVETLETVCGWLIRKVHENNVKTMSEVELNAFDSCCQAVMYILCYRCDEIANNDEKSKKRLQALPLREILYAQTLEPLQSCLPSVVHEFLKNASAANILGFTEDMIDTFSKQTEERKKIQDELRDKAYVRHDVSFAAKAMAAAVEKTNNTNNDAVDKSVLYHQERSRRRPLKMFFPFDPYVLRKSAPKLNLEESYVVWRGNDSDSEDDSEDDSDDNSESELALSDSEDDSSEEEENSASMDGSGEFIGRPQSKSSLSSGHLNRVRARSLGRSFNSAKFGTSLNARPKKQQNRSRGFSPKNTNGAGLPTGVLATQKGFRMPMPLSKSPSPSRGDVVAGYQSFSPLRGSFGGGFVKARSPSPNRRSSSPTVALTRAKVPPSSTLSAEVNNQAKGGGQQRRASTRSSSKRKS